MVDKTLPHSVELHPCAAETPTPGGSAKDAAMYATRTDAGPDRFPAHIESVIAAAELDSEHAEDEALANLDGFSDWLSAECMNCVEVQSHAIQFQVRMPGEKFNEGVYQLLLDTATVPQLQHILLTTTYERRSWLASQELKRRYLAAKGFNV
jgi:hypothetical protein